MRLNVTLPDDNPYWQKFRNFFEDGKKPGIPNGKNNLDFLIDQIDKDNEGTFSRDWGTTKRGVDETKGKFKSVQKLIDTYPHYIKKIFIAQYYNVNYSLQSGKSFDIAELFESSRNKNSV